MFRNVRRVLSLLSPEERRRAYILLLMVLTMAFLDTVGVGSILPFVAVLSEPNVVEENAYLNSLYLALEFPDRQAFLRFLGLMVFAALIAAIAFRALTTYSLLRFTHMRSFSLSRRLVSGYLRQPYEWFLNTHSSDLGKSVLSEVNEVVNRALIPMVQLVAHGAVAIAMISLLVVLNPIWAGGVAAGLVGIYGLVYVTLRRYLKRIGVDRFEANRERFKILQETFLGVKEVKLSALEDTSVRRFEGPANRFARRQAASQVANQLPKFALEAVAFGSLMTIVLYLMATPGQLRQAMPLLAVYALAGYRLLPALQQVYTHMASLRFAGPALDRLHSDIIELHSGNEEPDGEKPDHRMRLDRQLALDGISYSYPGSARQVLSDLAFCIPARTTIGLVGVTGSGKTTIVDIILGLLSVQSGRLLVDGVEITRENARSWQKAIGYVPQHIYLVDDTIAGNIAFGEPVDEVDQRAVERAARTANLHSFIVDELEDAYSTVVGERGVRLSGGQRQRIGIARALYHDPDLVILDEATSALDNVTEQAVMDAVHNLGRRKTLIIIAHRLSTVRRCDEIFVLESGQILESGPYDVLMQRSSRFRRMATAEHGADDPDARSASRGLGKA